MEYLTLGITVPRTNNAATAKPKKQIGATVKETKRKTGNQKDSSQVLRKNGNLVGLELTSSDLKVCRLDLFRRTEYE